MSKTSFLLPEHVSLIATLTVFFIVPISMSLMTTTQAQAKITCNGPWQKVKGVGEIATPYCEYGYLAQVARAAGLRVSANAIRQNPSRKYEVCQIVGSDIRVSDICAGPLDNDHDHSR